MPKYSGEPLLSPRCISRNWTRGGAAGTCIGTLTQSADVPRTGLTAPSQAPPLYLRFHPASCTGQPPRNTHRCRESTIRKQRKEMHFLSFLMKASTVFSGGGLTAKAPHQTLTSKTIFLSKPPQPRPAPTITACSGTMSQTSGP